MRTIYAKFKSYNAVLIQGAHTQPVFTDMLRMSNSRHAAYCLSHKMDYWCNYGNPCPDRNDGAWDKVYWVKQALQLHYDTVIWMDSDAVVNNFDCDLRDAIPDGIGAVCHDPDKSKHLSSRGIMKHNNVGVMYFKNSPIVKEFVNEWWDAYPGAEGWFEQGTFNDMIKTDKYKDIFHTVDDTWNSTVSVNWVDNPNVIGWHGTFPWARRVSMMRDFLKNDFLTYRI
jgi:hypothetical protein